MSNTVGVYFHQEHVSIMDQCGVSEIHTGINELTEKSAQQLVAKMRRLESSVPKSLQKRFRSYYMQITFAFGPEFEGWLNGSHPR